MSTAPRPNTPPRSTAYVAGQVIGWAIIALVALVVVAVLTGLLLLGAWSIGQAVP